ncbi:MAG: PEP-CTERM sorting domain-containing protein [Marinobacter sp.]|uniref:PEP-CTERM sorting domain-containing protein n=1 Tax=Marinobacter sp. TaxID=50741 RepID=UPI00299ED513|nr:PEP-CTERM sorting domain-containing protein [Marinobacter sp.]MDX1635219.1 PEP-CTERM sorting domain-containing protein [Marinobacter sp.]
MKRVFAMTLAVLATPVLAMPIDFGSKVVVRGSHVASQPGSVIPGACGASCSNPDLVHSSESSQDYDGQNRIYDYTYIYQSGSHGVANRPAPDGALPPLTPLPGHSRVSNYGYTDAGQTRMGGAAWATSDGPGYLTESRTINEMTNRATVGAGTSGLQNGDTVRLALNFRLDGVVRNGAEAWPANSYAASNMWASFKVATAETLPGPNGQSGYALGEELAYFGASMEAEAGDVYLPYWGHSYSATMNQDYWGRSNTGQTLDGSDGESFQGSAFSWYEQQYNFDTGLLSLEFDAIVGQELLILGYLETWAMAAGTAFTATDFSHTFGNVLTSTIDGIDLDWLIPAASETPVSVPEPQSAMLMALGLAGLVLRRRCSQRATTNHPQGA